MVGALCRDLGQRKANQGRFDSYLPGTAAPEVSAAPVALGAKAVASDTDCLLDLGLRTKLALLMNFFKPLGSFLPFSCPACAEEDMSKYVSIQILSSSPVPRMTASKRESKRVSGDHWQLSFIDGGLRNEVVGLVPRTDAIIVGG